MDNFDARASGASRACHPDDECSSRRPPSDSPPALGAIVRIRSNQLRVLGYATDKLILASTAPPFSLFLAHDDQAVPGLITFDDWRKLVRSNLAKVLPEGPPSARVDNVEKMSVQCDLLDASGVANGTKAISIWLHRNWSADLKAKYGEPDNPNTIRRWRRARRLEPSR